MRHDHTILALDPCPEFRPRPPHADAFPLCRHVEHTRPAPCPRPRQTDEYCPAPRASFTTATDHHIPGRLPFNLYLVQINLDARAAEPLPRHRPAPTAAAESAPPTRQEPRPCDTAPLSTPGRPSSASCAPCNDYATAHSPLLRANPTLLRLITRLVASKRGSLLDLLA